MSTTPDFAGNPDFSTVPATAENIQRYGDKRALIILEQLAMKVSPTLSLFVRGEHKRGTWNSTHGDNQEFTFGTDPNTTETPTLSKRLFKQSGFGTVPALEPLNVFKRLLKATHPSWTQAEIYAEILKHSEGNSYTAALTENAPPDWYTNQWQNSRSSPFFDLSLNNWPYYPVSNFPGSQGRLVWAPSPFVRAVFILNLGATTFPIFSEWLNPRKPRKWGRAWTPRWELEHAALVRQRKFSRNQKKIEEDNMKLRKRRTAKSRKRRAEKKRRDRRKLLAVPKACKPPVKYKVRRRSKRKK